LTAGHGRALLAVPDFAITDALRYPGCPWRSDVRPYWRSWRRGERAADMHRPKFTLDANIRWRWMMLQHAPRHQGASPSETKMRPGQLVLEYYDDAQLMRLYRPFDEIASRRSSL